MRGRPAAPKGTSPVEHRGLSFVRLSDRPSVPQPLSGLKSALLDSRPERTDFRPEKADFRPARADFKPERAWGANGG